MPDFIDYDWIIENYRNFTVLYLYLSYFINNILKCHGTICQQQKTFTVISLAIFTMSFIWSATSQQKQCLSSGPVYRTVYSNQAKAAAAQ